MSTRLCLLFYCLVNAWPAWAQVSFSLGDEATYIARVEQEAGRETNDSVRAATYFKLALLYKRINDLEKSKSFLQQGVSLAKNYRLLDAASNYYKAIVYYTPGNISPLERDLLRSDSALQPFTQAEAYKIRGIIWNNYGILQQVKGDERAALDVFTNKAIVYARQSGDPMVMGKTYKGMSIIFMNANQRDKAATYLRQAIESIGRSPLDNPVNLTELIEAYITAGENYVYLEQYDSAREMINAAKTALAPYPSSNLYMNFFFSEGVYFDKTKNYPQAVKSFDLGIALSTKLNSPYSLNRLKYVKYKSLYNMRQYQNAAAVLVDLLQSPFVFTNDKKLYYQQLYTTYEKLGNTTEAFRWASKYIILSDSLYEEKFQKDIIELESQYKHVENEKKIATLQAEKERSYMESRNHRLVNWLLGTVSLFLFAASAFAIILYRQKGARYQQKLKDAEQQQQLQLTKALMQGEEKERKRLAIDLHDGLGGQLAGIKINLSRLASNTSHAGSDLQIVIDQLDISSNELRRIARNMMPESLLLLGLEPALKDMCDSMSSDPVQVVFEPFHIDATLSKEIQLNVYRIVQELLTNALRHAQASEILVQCSQNTSRFFITIEDNGTGFDRAGIVSKQGIGLSNVRSRVDYLKGKLELSSAPGEGTTINIEFDVTT